MKSRNPDSPPKSRAKAAKTAASVLPPAAKSRKKAPSAAATGSAVVVTAKAAPARKAPARAGSAPKRKRASALPRAAAAGPAQAAHASAVRPKKTVKPARLRIPPILLEGDAGRARAGERAGTALRAGADSAAGQSCARRGGVARILRHATIVSDGARSALALRALGFHRRAN